MPKFRIETIEDAYTYYVLILGLSESIFWQSDYSDLLTIVDDKVAYDDWAAYARRKMAERR